MLYRCPAYEDLRNKFIFRLFEPIAHIKNNDLFATDDVEMIRSLSVYLFYAMERRDEALKTTVEWYT